MPRHCAPFHVVLQVVAVFLSASIVFFHVAGCSGAQPLIPSGPAGETGIVPSLLLSTPTAKTTCPPGAIQLPGQPWVCAYPTFTPSPTVPIAPTATPIPTLPDDQATEALARLLAENPDCRLPCWLGITPGETPWETASVSLGSLAEHWVVEVNNGEGGFGGIITRLPPQVDGTIEVSAFVSNGLVQQIRAYNPDGVEWLEVGRILKQYGPPSEVWVHTWSEYPGSKPPVELFLLYSDLGVLAHFGAWGTFNKESIHACFTDDTAYLYLWNPRQSLSYPEVVRLFKLTADGFDLSSDEALGVNAMEFFEGSQRSTELCLTTPRYIWPTISGRPYVPGR